GKRASTSFYQNKSDFDGLKYRFQTALLVSNSDLFWKKLVLARLPLELQVGLPHQLEGELAGLARFRFKPDDSVRVPGEDSFPSAAAFHGVAQGELRFLPLKSLIVFRFEQLTFHSGRTDLKRVMSRHHVFRVQHGTHLLRHQAAIGVGNALRLIDGDAHKPGVAAAFDLDLDEFQALGLRHSLRDFLDFPRYDC